MGTPHTPRQMLYLCGHPRASGPANALLRDIRI